jgi:6-phosphofructokinase
MMNIDFITVEGVIILKGNLMVGQAGGPTSVINNSLYGIIHEAKKSKQVERIYGMRFGIQGLVKGNIVDLKQEDEETIARLRDTPSSALGSSRYKLKDDDFPRVLEMLQKYNIRYFFMIGGNDTMDTTHMVEEYCAEKGYEIVCIGIPKTVDNDLFGTDHTPGFPTAARFAALSVKQGGILARDMQKVDQFVIYQSIGRNAGWLPASSVIAKEKESDAPHLIVIPERPLNKENFVKAVKRCYDKYGFVSIVCGEGATWDDGTPISGSVIRDKFGNIEFGAMGGTSTAMILHRIISSEFGWRGEFQITESLPMCCADRMAKVDREEAYLVGVQGVRLAVEGKSGVMVTLKRKSNRPYVCKTGTILLEEVAMKTKHMPDNYISDDGFFVTSEFIQYMKPLVGEMPRYAELRLKLV